jgi:hypothetical protein
MLWPFMPSAAHRAQLFAALGENKSEFVIGRWRAHRSDVESLHTDDVDKIAQAADEVANSTPGAVPIRAVLIQGHADFDLTLSGRAREDFELKISRARARHVLERMQAILALRRPLLTPDQQLLLDLVAFKTEGLGSRDRITTRPTNEFEMSLNRRAEIFFARAAKPIDPVFVILCPHGGQATRIGEGIPTANDVWLVVGCPNVEVRTPVEVPTPSPCLRINWVLTNEGVIDSTSVGLCIGPLGQSQGTAIVVA